MDKKIDNGYEEYIPRVKASLILEREDDIIIHLQATHQFLNDKIDESAFKNANRLESIEKRLDTMKDLLKTAVDLLKKQNTPK
ncbi:MAG: hypothetical protein U9N42_03385 [Campylobacterota bacterium]|nr:hypothetical protein [Campylobacterota bacterium]